MDRIDIITQIQGVKYENIIDEKSGDEESSLAIRKKVNDIIKIQDERFAHDKISRNSQMDAGHIKKYCELDSESRSFISRIYDTLALSVRGYNKILKVARTIADSGKQDKIALNHLEEAVMYRSIDRDFFQAGGL